MTLTLDQAKKVMAAALRKKLVRLTLDEARLTPISYAALSAFEQGQGESLRLVFDLEDSYGNESQRPVTVALVSRACAGGRYCWRVKLEASCWASSQEGTKFAMQRWRMARELARAALEAADAMPVITAEVTLARG